MKIRITIWVVLAAFLISACSQGKSATAIPTPTNPPAPTDTPAPTATAVPSATATATPTNTPTVVPTDTPTPTATSDLMATAAAKATAKADQEIAKIKDDLKYYTSYNLSIDEGSLAYFNAEDTTIVVDSYATSQYLWIGENLAPENFIFKTDVTWNTTMGFAGCGIFFHADDPSSDEANFYEFSIIRYGVKLGLYYTKNGKLHSLVPFTSDTIINGQNDDTNSLLLVARDGKISAYVNGKRVAWATSKAIPSGKIALQANQESGETTCTFANTWIWALP